MQRKQLILCALMLSVGYAALADNSAAERLCLSRRLRVVNGRVNLGQALQRTTGECPRRTNEFLKLDDFASPTELTALDNKLGTLDTKLAALGEDLESANRLVGFARVNVAGELKSFGGRGTTSATATRLSPGTYDVAFSGDFPGLDAADSTQNRERLTLLTSAHSNAYETANTQVISASRTEIVVRFYTWRSPTAATTNGQGGFVGVLLGEQP